MNATGSFHRPRGDSAMGVRGAIFDVDGVLVASPHEEAWREALEGFADPARFTTKFYQAYVAGRPRFEGARSALEHLGVSNAAEQSVAYADKKQALIERLIAAAILLPQAIVAAISPWVGRTADRAGRRPMLLLGWGLLPVQAVIYAAVPPPWSVLGGQALNGLSSAIFGVMTTLVAADLTRGKGQFNLTLGTLGVGIAVGASISTTFAGTVAAHFGAATAYLGLTLAGLCGLMLVWFRMPETRPTIAEPDAEPPSEATQAER